MRRPLLPLLLVFFCPSLALAAGAEATGAGQQLIAVATLASAALICGVVLTWLRQPAVIGYILAGVMLGPSALGLVTDRDAIAFLAELGVLLLLFIIGIELDLRRFREVWKTAVATALIQIAGSVGVMLLLRIWLGWSLGMALLLGYVVAISSTAVVLKMLEDADAQETGAGQATIGVLIAQDIAVVPLLLSLAIVAGGEPEPAEIALAGGSIILLVALVLALLRWRVRLPFAGRVAGHNDLGPLAGLAACCAAAALSGIAGLSAGYGAFLAGLVIGNSAQGPQLAHDVHPIHAMLLMVFFVSVGLLLDLNYLIENIGIILALLGFVLLFKTVLNIGALRLMGQPWPDAILAGVIMAQIGEFSFLLAGAGRSLNLITEDQVQMVVAVTVLSLLASPVWMALSRRLGQLSRFSVIGLDDLWYLLWRPEARVFSRLFRRRQPLPPPPEPGRDA